MILLLATSQKGLKEATRCDDKCPYFVVGPIIGPMAM